MNKLTKRFVALLMAVVLVVGLAPAVSFSASAATVDYRYASSSGYIYNWGTRGETATYLSQNAEAFYTGNYTYESLSALQGSSNVSSVPDSTLYYKLKTLMTSAQTYQTSYDDTRELFQFTDCQGSGYTDNGKISSFYSGKTIGPSWDSGKTWNREHTWPNSKGDASGNGENDIMMLRPTSSTENSSRGNSAYGESSGYYDPNELGQNVRGDAARIMLYVYVRWGNTGSMWGSSGVMESRDVLLKWIEEDPVDTWELGRNDSVQSITGTRNVFVDYPELAFILLGAEIPEDMATPSGAAQNGGMSYTVTATTNNSAYGTVSVSGNQITAVPAPGYFAGGYTVTSGTATVYQNGNVFTVDATANCTVQINFYESDTVAVTFSGNGTVLSSEDVFPGQNITLPEYTGTAYSGYTFVGWLTNTLEDTSTRPTLYLPGVNYQVSAATAFYAVYEYIDGASTSSAWQLVTNISQLSAGNKVVIVATNYDKAMSATQDSNNRKTIAIIKNADSTVSFADTDGVAVLTLENGKQTGTYAFYAGEGYLYAASSTANHLKTQTSLTDNSSWAIEITSDGVATVKAQGEYSRNWMRYNNGSDLFSCYSSGQTDISLYTESAGGTRTYTTSFFACAHDNISQVEAQAPTATQPGYTEGIYCNDCGKYVEGHDILPALGYSYSVSFTVPTGVTAVDSMTAYSDGISLPTAGAPEGYTFLGWYESIVDNATAKPTGILPAGDTFKPTANTVLRAVYSYEKTVSGGDVPSITTWDLVTDVSQLADGKRVIIAASPTTGKHANTTVAMGAQNGNFRDCVTVTVTDNTLELAEGVQILTLEAGTGTNNYAFKVSDGQYLHWTSGNYVKTGALSDTASYFTISAASPNVTITHTATTARKLQFNASNPRFACYTSNQVAPQMFVETTTTGGSGMVDVTYYTTVVSGDCDHNGAVLQNVTAATCTENGYTGDLYCGDCEQTLSQGQGISATGHASAVYVPAKEGSCLESRWDAHYDCGDCGKLVVEKTANATEYTVPASGNHTYTDSFVCDLCHVVTITVDGVDFTDPEDAYTLGSSSGIFDCDTELKANVDLSGKGEIGIDAGTTLDLMGKTLTVDSLDGFTLGGNVIDSVGGGKLIVREAALFALDNTQLPIKLSDGSYVFEKPDLIQGHRDDAFVTGDSHYAYKFYLNNLKDDTLMDDYLGDTDADVQIIVTVNYTDSTGSHSKEFRLSGEIISEYVADWDNKMVVLHLTGLTGITALSCNAQVVANGVYIC